MDPFVQGFVVGMIAGIAVAFITYAVAIGESKDNNSDGRR